MKKIALSSLVLLISSFLFCQSNNLEDQRTYFTKKINTKSPDIDGILSDDCWNLVDWSGDFTQYQPNDGEDPTQ